MSGSHGADSTSVQIGENGDGQCGSFGRIRSGSKLIKQNQRILIYIMQERDNICHMRREGTQALLNALLISDICIDLFKHCQFRTVSGRDVKAGLSHQGKKSYGF